MKSKTQLLHIFIIFGAKLYIYFFSKKYSSDTHNSAWAPNTMLSFVKQLMSQFQENFRTEK